MKGVSFSVEFILAIVIVVAITLLAFSLLKPVAGFDIRNFFKIQFPGGTPGETEYISGGQQKKIEPTEIEQITSQNYEWDTPSEVAVSLSEIIYNDMRRNGNNGDLRYDDSRNSCFGKDLQDSRDKRCIIGDYTVAKLGYITKANGETNEDPQKFIDKGFKKCSDLGKGIYLDEACLNMNWNVFKVGATPFCSTWRHETEGDVKFSNNLCAYVDGMYGGNCWECQITGTNWETDRVKQWAADDRSGHPFRQAIGKDDREVYTVKEGALPVVNNNTEYMIYVETRTGINDAENEFSRYQINFIRKVPEFDTRLSASNLAAILKKQIADTPYPTRYNDLGYFADDARTVLEMNVEITDTMLVRNFIDAISDFSNNFRFVPCSSPKGCENNEIKKFTMRKYGDGSIFFADDILDVVGGTSVEDDGHWHDEDIASYQIQNVKLSFFRINFRTDEDINGEFTPGVYKVIVRNWFTRLELEKFQYVMDMGAAFYDRTIIIYKIPESELEKGDISVNVTDTDGSVAKGVDIGLQDSEGNIENAKTDQNGEYTFENQPYGSYSISSASLGPTCPAGYYGFVLEIGIKLDQPVLNKNLQLHCCRIGTMC